MTLADSCIPRETLLHCTPCQHVTVCSVSQLDINDKMRAILIDWLVEVHLKFKVCTAPPSLSSVLSIPAGPCTTCSSDPAWS